MSRTPAELRQLAQSHLWGHFSRLDPGDGGAPIIERGDGCWVWDVEGKRYLDGLAGLFTVQIGHGGPAQPRFRMHPHPGMAGLDADFQHHRAIIGVQRLPNALALAFLLTARGSRA